MFLWSRAGQHVETGNSCDDLESMMVLMDIND